MQELLKTIDCLNNEKIWSLYAKILKMLKHRGLIRTRNITGERGEFLAIETYRNDPKLPNLQAAPEGTRNVDALSRNGDRYSIKTITIPGKTTGVFYDIGTPEEENKGNQKFEYLVIVLIDDNFMPNKIIELSWNKFLKYKKWHKRMQAWNISITKELLNDCRIIYQ